MEIFLLSYHIFLICSSASAEGVVVSDEIDKALDAGSDGFLSKPLDRALLFSVLAENILHEHSNERFL